MSRYYFLATALPSLNIEEEPEIAFRDLLHLLRDNLSKRDYKTIEQVRTYYDILNIRHFWKEEPIDPHGNLTSVEIEEAVVTGSALPDYVHDFLREVTDHNERLKRFPKLIVEYFAQSIANSSGFLKEYLEMERGLRLTFLGFRAKQLARNLSSELQYEDPSDELVLQLLAQRDAAHYEPPFRFEATKQLFEHNQSDPVALHKAVLDYRFRWVDEQLGTDTFSMDAILAYFVQFLMVEAWASLDQKQGNTIIDQLLRDVS